jgi:hypothetical protein
VRRSGATHLLTGDGLREQVEAYAATPSGDALPKDAKHVVGALLAALESGEVRAAVNVKGRWEAVPWVKRGILLGFRAGELQTMGAGFRGSVRQPCWRIAP